MVGTGRDIGKSGGNGAIGNLSRRELGRAVHSITKLTENVRAPCPRAARRIHRERMRTIRGDRYEVRRRCDLGRYGESRLCTVSELSINIVAPRPYIARHINRERTGDTRCNGCERRSSYGDRSRDSNRRSSIATKLTGRVVAPRPQIARRVDRNGVIVAGSDRPEGGACQNHTRD